MAGLVLLTALLTVAYLLFPARHTSLWAAIGLLGVAAVLVGVRIHRPVPAWPWLLLAVASLAFTAGDTTYNVMESLLGHPNPFPSAADALYLVTYPLYAAGLFGFIRARSPGRDLASLLDALILTLAVALFFWQFLISPVTSAEGTDRFEKLISIAYPLGDVLILALLLRLLAPGGGRSWSVRLLVLGSLGILTSDVLYGYLQMQGTWQVGTPMDLGWVVFFTAWGLAALHPSMVELTEPVPPAVPGVPRRRLVLLSTACLVAPAMLAYEAQAARPRETAVLATCAAVMFLLVLTRLWGVMADHRRSVAREHGLRVAAGSLVSAINRREVADSIDRAATMLFDPGVRHATLLLVPASDGSLYALPTPRRPWSSPLGNGSGNGHGSRPRHTLSSHSRLLRIDELWPDAAAELRWLPEALVCPLATDRPGAERETAGVMLVAAPKGELLRLWGALESLGAQAALALDRVLLNQEIGRRDSEAYFRTLVHNASDVILIVNDDDTVRYASPSADAMFPGMSLQDMPLAQLLHTDDSAAVLDHLARIRSGDTSETRDDWRVLRRGEDHLDVEVRCSNLRQESTVRALVLTLHDVTEQRQLEKELTHRAFHDPLTGLPNRVLLLERIERALLRGLRDTGLTGVLFIDLDDFKVVNDTMGHSLGDELLTAVARRLTSAVRRSDTAARLGGDEFAVLIEGSQRPEDAEKLAEQVVQALWEPFHLSSGTANISASVGVATSQDSADSEQLLGHADLALYAAKTAGKRQWRHFRSDLHSGLRERHELQAGLDHAIAEEAFALRYQPIVQISSGDLVGFEALVRWPQEQHGLVSPDEFINLAEETGQIMPLGAWVLARAASDVARWQQLRPRAEPLSVNVNVSARQFRDPAFLGQVRQVLDTSGLAPRSLILELTETAFMRRDEQVRTTMATLKELGVSIAIDDFGTGYSSLSYIRDFPVDMLKVDKSFIDDITADAQQVALVEGIVRIADVLGLQVVAEGIEERGQRDLLSAMGCHFGQGFLFARPMAAKEAEHLLLDGFPQGSARTTSRRSQQRPEGWAIRRDPRWGDLSRLWQSSRMCDAVIDEVSGRRIRCQDHWLTDFASCNYLGFDLDPEIMDSIGPQVRRWGTHPSWSRLIGSPNLYPRIEERLAGLLGAPDTLVLPTITLIHQSVIPVLAGEGHVFVEAKAHRTVYDGCVVARGHGATVQRFHADRPEQLDTLLAGVPAGSSRLVCLDGVNSMTGNCPDLGELTRVCREHGALLYVDDAHGFGVIGERRPDETSPYGCRGNSIIRHLGESYEGIVLVGGFSKAYSSLLAFLALPTWLKEHLKVAAAPYLYSGPSPTASLATVLAGLDVNERRGDALRGELYRRTASVLDHLRRLDVGTPNGDGLPIIEIPLADAADLDAVSAFLWDRGIYVTLAAYPLVPRTQVGFRMQITASNTDEQIEELNATLTDLSRRFPLRSAGAPGMAGSAAGSSTGSGAGSGDGRGARP